MNGGPTRIAQHFPNQRPTAATDGRDLGLLGDGIQGIDAGVNQFRQRATRRTRTVADDVVGRPEHHFLFDLQLPRLAEQLDLPVGELALIEQQRNGPTQARPVPFGVQTDQTVIHEFKGAVRTNLRIAYSLDLIRIDITPAEFGRLIGKGPAAKQRAAGWIA